MKWVGTGKGGQAGCGGPTEAGRYRHGLTLLLFAALLLAGGDTSLPESPTVARMRRGGALSTGATGIMLLNIIRNKSAPRVASLEATGERGQKL